VPPTLPMEPQSVSVVIPTYGRAALLPRVVDTWAALAPSVAGGCQVVVVDDGSPDATASVLGGLAERHPGLLTVVRQPNGGRSSARNAGIAAASGELLLFSD